MSSKATEPASSSALSHPELKADKLLRRSRGGKFVLSWESAFCPN